MHGNNACVFLSLQINKELFALFGMKQIVMSYPRMEDTNERTCKKIKTFLNKYCMDHPNDWDDHLSAIAYAFNLTHLVCLGSVYMLQVVTEVGYRVVC